LSIEEISTTQDDDEEEFLVAWRAHIVDSIDHFIITNTATLIASLKTGQIYMTNGAFTNLSLAQAAEIESTTKGSSLSVGIPGSTDWGSMMNVNKAPSMIFESGKLSNWPLTTSDLLTWFSMVPQLEPAHS